MSRPLHISPRIAAVLSKVGRAVLGRPAVAPYKLDWSTLQVRSQAQTTDWGNTRFDVSAQRPFDGSTQWLRVNVHFAEGRVELSRHAGSPPLPPARRRRRWQTEVPCARTPRETIPTTSRPLRPSELSELEAVLATEATALKAKLQRDRLMLAPWPSSGGYIDDLARKATATERAHQTISRVLRPDSFSSTPPTWRDSP